MAVRTARRAVLGYELSVVGVFVAGFALHWRPLESLIRVAGCLVTLSTRHRAMGAQKGELGL